MNRTGTVRKPNPRPTNAGKRKGKYCQLCGGYISPGQTEHKCYEVKR